MNASVSSQAISEHNGKSLNKLSARLNLRIGYAKRVCISPRSPFTAEGKPERAVCHEREWPDEKPSKFGLKRLGVDFKKFPDMPEVQYSRLENEDIFYAPELGDAVRTVITCNAKESTTPADGREYRSPPFISSPQCRHEFIFQPLNALVSIGYRRIYLKDWQTIQASWERLLQSFVIEAQPRSRKGDSTWRAH